MKPPDRIRLRLLGGFELDRDDGIASPVRLSTRKACALVAFLAMSRKQAATREELAALLWGSCSDQQARQSLRQALASIRKDLRSPHVLFADNEVVRLQPGIWSVDALELEALADSPKLEDLERAVELFGGEFLAGFSIEEEGFDEWLQAQRNRIRSAAGRVLATYAERSDAAGDGPQAIAAAERLLALDPLREDWQRRALRLHARHHGPHDALARAKTFEALLRRELDVEPEPETVALVERIRRGEIAPLASEGCPAEPSARSPSAQGIFSSSPMETDLGAGAKRSNAQDEVRSRRRWLWPLGAWSGRGVAAGLTVAAVVLFGGVIGLMHRGALGVGIDDVSDRKPVEAATTADHLWRSPRLPSQRADSSPGRNFVSIAVLPFTTYGDTAGSIQLAADMLTDDLINSLSRAPLLRVISRQTTRSYQNKPIDIAAIGAELGVRYILEGTLRMQGDKLRVNVELIDPKTRVAVRAVRIERGSTELPAVHDEIIGRLARELPFEIIQVESDRAPKDPNVAELNFKGWAALLASGMSGMDGLKLGKGYFDEALARDPENGIARPGVGAYHAMVGALKLDADSEVHLREAEQILRQVVHEYPRNTTANLFLGVSFRAFGRFEDAIDCFERVLEISQSYAPAYAHLGEALVALGRAHEGIDHIRYALRLSPRDPSLSHWLRFAGQAELELNHHEQAVAYLRQSYALNSRLPGTLRSLAAALAVSGQTEDARRYAAEFRAVAPHLDEKGLQKRHPARETRQPELARGIGLAFVGSL